MFALSQRQITRIRQRCQEIRDGGDKAFAKAWLVWATLFSAIHEAGENPGATHRAIEEAMPLILAFQHDLRVEPELIQECLKQSLLRAVWRAKLDGRNDLDIDDATWAVQALREQLTP